ncbi:putative snf2 family helicase protein [Botryosphaeria dothidea]|uniref:Snf2 family helicase protein n=1 Tax=Botryosphaeria dothidea TaxID=55169 RepID=A0A8H4N8Y8_9PEZI|nr:putative snf2 family helicase protein [Botryosphaeria dothidea]
MTVPSRKRTIDLTADDDDDVQITGSQTRKTPRLADVPFEDDEADESALEEVVDPSQEYNDRAFIQYMLYGTLNTKIVGVRYYNGYATIGEMVMLRREPHNPYDSNAIQVLNVQEQQIGHIPRQVAAKLVPYMDSRGLILEGVITGHKGTFDCPLAVKLYGTSDPVERLNLTNQMKADRLPLGAIKRVEKAERDRIKATQQAAKKQKVNAWAGKSDGQWATGEVPGSSQPDERSMDDILGESERFNPRDVEQMVEKFGAQEADLQNLPMAKQPEEMSAQLLPYQLQGLKWLLDHENPQLPAAGSADVVQLWRRAPNEANVFTNICTNYSIKNKLPELASGGILADDMGLGKTVQIISLIMAESHPKRAEYDQHATLILAPLSVMILTYHGTRKKLIDPKEIKNYDVVITTYETIMTEFWTKQSKSPQQVPRKTGLFSVNWRRIVLDEGHNIRNPASKKAVAAVNLMARSRWVLTGTPIINTLNDLYSWPSSSALRFLLQMLMGSICLRRRKDMSFIDLRLPELSEYVHRIKFLPHEQEKYDALEAQAKGTLDRYRQNLSGRDAAKAYQHLLETLLRLRQVCNHWKLCGEERITGLLDMLSEQKTVDLTPENRAALQQMLQLSIDSQEDCAICLEPLHDPRVIEGQHKCPMCRAELPSTASLVRPAKEAAAPPPIDADTNSSKIEALLKILKATANKEKVVQDHRVLPVDVLPQHSRAAAGRSGHSLRSHRWDYVGPSPVMPLWKHSKTTRTARFYWRPCLFCSVGLNLVAASQVVLADSWWAPAIEDQAVDRVHRLGQKRETTCSGWWLRIRWRRMCSGFRRIRES